MNAKFREVTFNQTIDEIKNKNAPNLAQAVLSTALLSEYLIKEVLYKINPLAPYSLSYLTSAHNDFAAVVLKSGEESSRLTYDNFGVLLSRSKSLNALDEKAIELIGAIKNVRNGIAHKPKFDFDEPEAQVRMLQLFIDHREVFSETFPEMHLTEDIVTQLTETRTHIQAVINERLENRIKKAAEDYSSLSKEKKVELLESGGVVIEAEGRVLDDMLCPACNNRTLNLYFQVDFDYGDGDTVISGSQWFACPICELSMSDYEFEDLNDDPNRYTKRTAPDESWNEYFNLKHAEENFYDYI